MALSMETGKISGKMKRETNPQQMFYSAFKLLFLNNLFEADFEIESGMVFKDAQAHMEAQLIGTYYQ